MGSLFCFICLYSKNYCVFRSLQNISTLEHSLPYTFVIFIVFYYLIHTPPLDSIKPQYILLKTKDEVLHLIKWDELIIHRECVKH